MSIDRKTRAFVKELQRAYFEMRDTEKILSMATEDVLWSGLYHSNIHESGGLEAVLEADFSRFQNSLQPSALMYIAVIQAGPKHILCGHREIGRAHV